MAYPVLFMMIIFAEHISATEHSKLFDIYIFTFRNPYCPQYVVQSKIEYLLIVRFTLLKLPRSLALIISINCKCV